MHCTFYTHSAGPLADGSRYEQRGYFCASNAYPLGTVLRLTSRITGRSVTVTVRDRSARRVRRPDLCSRAFSRLAGCHEWRQIGVLPVTVRVVRHAHQTKHCHAFRSMRRHG